MAEAGGEKAPDGAGQAGADILAADRNGEKRRLPDNPGVHGGFTPPWTEKASTGDLASTGRDGEITITPGGEHNPCPDSGGGPAPGSAGGRARAALRRAAAGAGKRARRLARRAKRRLRRANPRHAAEWTAGLALLAVGLYYLWGLLFAVGPAARSPEEEARLEFRAKLFALTPPAPEPEWRVAARPGRWRGVIIHHTATAGGSPAAIDRHHREVNKWPNGLGYHFLIGNGKGMGDGEVAVGRRWKEQDRLDGAHVLMSDAAKEKIFQVSGTATGNSFSIGVALVGDFRQEAPSPAQLAALRSLLAFLTREYGIGHGAIAGHNQVSASHTACPGRRLLVDEVAASLARP